jgi:4a-hydroxytetrahydrobiopterin dehydratase
MPITKLDDAAITSELARLSAWRRDGDKLFREYVFADFVTAVGFMMSTALVAEKIDHHPEWFNVYGTVRVHLGTHDVDGISALDFQLAHAMDALAEPLLR